MNVIAQMAAGSATGTAIYPATQTERNRIPLWMKFYIYPYLSGATTRAAQYMSGMPMIRSIMVPAPKEFSTKTLIRYDDSVNEKNPSKNLTSANIPALVSFVENWSYMGIANRFVDLVDNTMEEAMGLGQSEKMDMYDATFQAASKRAFQTKIIMPAWTADDAIAASKVASIFEAFALPSAKFQSTYSSTMDHPPCWQMGIGSANAVRSDLDWSGQPLLSVLTSVVTSRMGFNEAYGISEAGGSIKPMCIIVNLNFLEIEPALRSAAGSSDTIINRSTAFLSKGGILVDAAKLITGT